MNFQTICRICTGETTGTLSIFDSYNFSAHNREIFKVITDCASVQIQSRDGFSERICRGCLDHLSQAYSFKKLCEDSDYKFRNNLIAGVRMEIKEEISEEDTSGEIDPHNFRNNLIENVKIEIKDEISEDNSAEIDNYLTENTKESTEITDADLNKVREDLPGTNQDSRVILSKRGKPQFYIEGHKFSYQKRLSGNKKKWLCISRSTGCRAYVKTEGADDVIMESSLIHNHEKSSLIMKQIFSNNAKRAAIEDVNERPIKIIRKLLEECDSETITAKDIMNVRRNISRSRSSYRSKLSKQ